MFTAFALRKKITFTFIKFIFKIVGLKKLNNKQTDIEFS